MADEFPSRIRINKFFTKQGICSRREADRLIEDGRVMINGRQAVLGDRVTPADTIHKDGVPIPWGRRAIYIKFHKPVGITTTSEPDVPGNIIAFINHPERIFPVGRLDKDSSGLILLTNDGDIVNEILRAENGHEKEYRVRLERPYDEAFLERMAEGVVILGSRTRRCTLTPMGAREFRIILTEGRNRQIRRMCRTLGYRVIALTRTRIMHISLGDLPVGQWRNLSESERQVLLRAIGSRSHSSPV
jgi:23S rRNA pseudouridine2604 synthase